MLFHKFYGIFVFTNHKVQYTHFVLDCMRIKGGGNLNGKHNVVLTTTVAAKTEINSKSQNNWYFKRFILTRNSFRSSFGTMK